MVVLWKVCRSPCGN